MINAVKGVSVVRVVGVVFEWEAGCEEPDELCGENGSEETAAHKKFSGNRRLSVGLQIRSYFSNLFIFVTISGMRNSIAEWPVTAGIEGKCFAVP